MRHQLGKFSVFCRNALAVFRRKRQRRQEAATLAPLALALQSKDFPAIARMLDDASYKERIRDADISLAGLQSLLEVLGEGRVSAVKAIRPHNFAGYVTHYHHYFGAIVLPLLEWLTVGVIAEGDVLVVRDCGPMNEDLKQWASLFKISVVFAPPMLVDATINSGLAQGWEATPYDNGFHEEWYPRSDILEPIRAMVLSRTKFSSSHQHDQGLPCVLVVCRDRPDAYYKTPRADRSTAGSDRRSVPNMQDIANEVAKIPARVEVLFLERMRVIDKVQRFAMADLVIAQMGAGLNNILWMKRGAAVLEIIPVEELRVNFSIFGNLCGRVGVNHRRIIQASTHSPVPMPLALGFAKWLLSCRAGVSV